MSIRPQLNPVEHVLHQYRNDPDALADLLELEKYHWGFTGVELTSQTQNLRGPIWEALAAAPKSADIHKGFYPSGNKGLMDEFWWDKQLTLDDASPSPTCWASRFDLTGVSWQSAEGPANASQQRCTLIGDQVAIVAAHWSPPVGSTRIFRNKWGQSFEAIVQDKVNLYSDISVVAFDLPIDPSIPRYGIAEDLAFGQFLLACRSRLSQGSQPGGTSNAYQRVTWDRIATSDANLQSSPNLVWSARLWFRERFTLNGVPNQVRWANDLMAYRDEANGGDSGDPLFTSLADGTLELASTYHTASSSKRLSSPEVLTPLDAQLQTWGLTRGAAAAVSP